jgi:preprotein translocase subunit SecG
MPYTIATFAHIFACFFMVIVVLLQTGKGADVGAVFGGSSQTVFGSSGAGNFLTKMTTGIAILFMLTSLFLSYGATRRTTESLFDSVTPTSPAVQTEQTEAAPGAEGSEETGATSQEAETSPQQAADPTDPTDPADPVEPQAAAPADTQPPLQAVTEASTADDAALSASVEIVEPSPAESEIDPLSRAESSEPSSE